MRGFSASKTNLRVPVVFILNVLWRFLCCSSCGFLFFFFFFFFVVVVFFFFFFVVVVFVLFCFFVSVFFFSGCDSLYVESVCSYLLIISHSFGGTGGLGFVIFYWVSSLIYWCARYENTPVQIY